VRVIGLVVIIMIIAGIYVIWPRPEAPEPQAVTVAIPADEALHAAFQEARRVFVAAHKNIDIILVEASEDKLPAYEAIWRKSASKGAAAKGSPGAPGKGGAVSAGANRGRMKVAPGRPAPAGVDLIVGGESYLARWARAGLLEPWDEFLAQRNLRLSEAALAAGRIGGKQALLPLALELPVISFTPPAATASAGETTQPDSLQALQTLAAKLSEVSGSPALDAPWSGVWAEAVLLATAHAEARRDENVHMMLSRTKAALTWWRSGIASGWAITPGARPVAYAPAMSWAGQRAWFEARHAKVRLLLPPGAQDRGTVCVVYGATLPAKSQHKDAAQQFAAHLLSFRVQRAFAERTGLLPAAVAPWARLKDARWEALKAAASRSAPLPPELRDAEAVRRFTRTAIACLRGEEQPQAAAAKLAKLW
jgi:ABC-type glycerol-3-phosphate transport system substrate-binding protein